MALPGCGKGGSSGAPGDASKITASSTPAASAKPTTAAATPTATPVVATPTPTTTQQAASNVITAPPEVPKLVAPAASAPTPTQTTVAVAAPVQTATPTATPTATSTPTPTPTPSPAVLSILEGSSANFGTKIVGLSGSFTLTLQNSGGSVATLGDVSASGLGLIAPYSVTGSTCVSGGSVAVGSSCTITIRFAPTASGTSSGSATVGYNNGVSTQSVALSVSGVGQSPAALATAEGASYDFGTKTVGLVSNKVLTVQNTGGASATLGTISAAGLGISAPYSVTGGTCSSGASLASGASCTIDVRYAPSSSGSSSGTATVAYNNGVNSQSMALSLVGVGQSPAALATAEGASYDFGTRTVGLVSDKTITLQNAGGVSAVLGTINASALGISAVYSVTGGTCATGGSVAAGASCTIDLRFTPVAAGSNTSNATIGYNNGVSNQSVVVSLSGVGQSPAQLATAEGASYDFGTRTVGNVSDKTLTVQNSGGVSATLGTLDASGLGFSAPYSVTGGTCASGANLAAGASCTILVRFAPSAGGSSSATATVGYNNGVGNQSLVLALSGVGQTPATLATAEGASYDFGTRTVGAVSDKTVTVQNSGGVSATLGAIDATSLGISAPYSLTGGTCVSGGSLAAGGSCTILLRYSPSASGSSSETATLGYNDGIGSQSLVLSLSGIGQLPGALASAEGGNYDFGTKTLGLTSDKTVTIQNSGGVSATLGTISSAGIGVSAPYSMVAGGTCATGATLAAGANCTILIRFTPTASGANSGAASIAYNDGNANQSLSVSFSGTGQNPASLTTVEGASYDFGTKTIGLTADKTVTVQNSGGASATLGTVSAEDLGIAAPYSLIGGTCVTGSVLAGGASCTVLLRYSPSAASQSTATVTLSYSDVIGNKSVAVSLAGTGVTPASLAASGSSDFGARTIGTTFDRTITLANSGGSDSTLGSISSAGLGISAPYSVVGGTCASSGVVAAGASCTLVLRFSPSGSGQASGSAVVNYNNGVTGGTVTVSLVGSGLTVAALAVSGGASYDYGSKATGTTTARTFTIQNSGGSNATLGTVTTAGLGLSGPFTLAGGSCATGGAVAGGGSCTLIINFAPSAGVQSTASAALQFNNGLTGQSMSLALTGTGTAPAVLGVSEGSSIDFGSLTTGTHLDRTITVENSGGTAATLGTVTTAGLGLADPFSYMTGSCVTAGSIAAGSSCTLTLRFSPTASQSETGTLQLSYDDGATSQSVILPLSGSGIGPALLAIVEGDTASFGSVIIGALLDRTLTLSNSGGSSATLGTLTAAGVGISAPYSVAGGTCTSGGLVNAGGGSCTLILRYTPSASTTSNATGSVSYNNGATTQGVPFSLTGSGLTPATLAITEGASLAFGSVLIGATSDKTIHLQNSGQSAGTLGSISAEGLGLSASYSVTGGTCSTGLAVSAGGGSCSIDIRFTPSTAGSANVSASIPYHNGLSNQSLALAVSGSGLTPAVLNLGADSAGHNYSYQPLTGTEDYTFTLSNSGTGAAILGTLSDGPLGLSAPFSLVGGTCTTGSSVTSGGGSCTMIIRYAPTVAGAHSGAAVVAYNNGLSDQSINLPLSGEGVPVSIPVVTSPSASPVYSKNSSLTISGTCDYRTTVNVAGSASQSVGCAGDGTFAFTLTALVDGSYAYNVTESLGSRTSSAAVVNWERDTTAPSAPTLTSPVSGGSEANAVYTSAGDGITIAGVCESNATVALSGASSQTVTCSSGTYSFTIADITSDGTYNYSVIQTDRATNASNATSLAWTRQTNIPTTPTLASPAASPAYSNGSSLALSVGCTSGNSVWISGDMAANTTCSGGGTASFTLNKSSDATYTYEVIQKNASNVASAALQFSWVRDTVVPSAPTITNHTSPYGSPDTSLVISGVCETGATVNVSSSSSLATSSGSTTASQTCSGTSYSFTFNTVWNGAYTFTLSQTDRASNSSDNATFVWNRSDTTLAAPSLTSPVVNGHDGHFYSNQNSITVVGSCGTGNKVQVSGSYTSAAGGITCTASSFSFTDNQTSNGNYTYYVTQTDTTSGAGSGSSTYIWTRDTQVPSAPTITGPGSSPYTSEASVVSLSGACEPYATVRLALSGDADQTVQCGAGGTYSGLSSLSKSSDGTYAFTVWQADEAGNSSFPTAAKLNYSWVRNTTLPAAPTILTPVAIPNANPYIYTNGNTFTVSGGSGSCESSFATPDTVHLKINGSAVQDVQCSSGAYSFSQLTKTVDGTYTITVSQQRSWMSQSSGDATAYWVRDTAPVTVSITADPGTNHYNDTNASFSFTTNKPTSGYVSFQCQIDGGGFSSCTSPKSYSSLTNGSHTFSVKGTDLAGNVSSTATFTWTQTYYKTLALYHMENSLADSSSYGSQTLLENFATVTTNSATAKFGSGSRSIVESSGLNQGLKTPALGGWWAGAKKLLTVEGWFYINNTVFSGNAVQTFAGITDKANPNLGWDFGLKNASKMYFSGSTNGTSTATVESSNSSASVSANTWYHVAMTYDASTSPATVCLYFNGNRVLQDTTTFTGNLNFPASYPFTLGYNFTATGSTQGFIGWIPKTTSDYIYLDEVRISQFIRYSGATYTVPTAAFSAD